MAIGIGSRVRIRDEYCDRYIQPWRDRFKARREGTVVGGPSANIKGWQVLWDHKRAKRPNEWRLVHDLDDLIEIE